MYYVKLKSVHNFFFSQSSFYEIKVLSPNLPQLTLGEVHYKGLIILAQAGGVLADFWVPNEIDSLNFQHMLLF